MRVVVTGTPGTGKTTALEALDTESQDHLGGDDSASDIVHLNDAIREHDLWTERDADRDTLVTDLDGVREWLGDWDGIVESHLAHHLDADTVVVLRCRPDVLQDRLVERGESAEKARENAESEALDVILSEAFEFHGADKLYEIDTTERTPEEVAGEIQAVLDGERDPSAGTVDFVDYL